RFLQFLASRNTLFNLSNFLDKTGSHGVWRLIQTIMTLYTALKEQSNSSALLQGEIKQNRTTFSY
ncbi:hypothetical protein GOODEAATRI_022246, partial [Goodea atripinnis]